jgi:putative sigma-54 modulation protein
MKVETQSIHFKADQKLVDYIQRKLDKLETFYDGIIDAQVYLKVENTSSKENKTAEFKVNVQHNALIKSQTATTFEAATDLAVEALKKQLKRYKGRMAQSA